MLGPDGLPDLESLGVTAEILRRLDAAGLVIVPRTPTPAMLEAGWYEANDEDAAGVWRVMIEESQKTLS